MIPEVILLPFSGLLGAAVIIAVPLVWRREFVYVFIPWFFQSMALVSVFALEHGGYITEQSRHASFSGATWRLALFNALFFAAAWFFSRSKRGVAGLQDVRFSKNVGLHRVLLAVAFTGLGLSYLNLVLTGVPALNPELTRFNFWNRATLPWLSQVFGSTGAILVLLLGTTFALAPTRSFERWLALGGFGVYMLYAFLLGHRFNLPFIAVYYFALPWVAITIYGLAGRRKITRVAAIMAGATLAIFGLSVFLYAESSAGLVATRGSVVSAVWYRVVYLQGHTWWGADYNYFILDSGAAGFSAFLGADTVRDVMTYVSPTQGPRYDANNIRFAVLHPAAGLYYFGAVGLVVVQIALGAAYAAAIRILKIGLEQRWPLWTLLATFLLWRLNQIVIMADSEMFQQAALALVGLAALCVVRYATGGGRGYSDLRGDGHGQP